MERLVSGHAGSLLHLLLTWYEYDYTVSGVI
jgi:hypothetical protein